MSNRLFKVQDLLHKEIAMLLHTSVQNPEIKSVTISGVRVSKDLKYSEIVAKHIGSERTIITVSEEDFISSIEDVKKIKSLNNSNVEGVIVGKSIYDGDIKINELAKEI